MPRIKIAEVIDYLDYQILDALREAVGKVLPDSTCLGSAENGEMASFFVHNYHDIAI